MLLSLLLILADGEPALYKTQHFLYIQHTCHTYLVYGKDIIMFTPENYGHCSIQSY